MHNPGMGNQNLANTMHNMPPAIPQQNNNFNNEDATEILVQIPRVPTVMNPVVRRRVEDLSKPTKGPDALGVDPVLIQ